MRHGKGFNHLSRKSPHRKAMLSNMATSLIMNKRIKTTIAKAKALRSYVEPLITKSKKTLRILEELYLVICKIKKVYLNYLEKLQ